MKGRKGFIALLAVFVLVACSHKKKISLSGENPVDVKDFIESFETLSLPFQIADTSLVKRSSDTTVISYHVLHHLVPDSVLNKIFGKEVRPKIYPVGRVSSKEGNYLFIKALSAERRAAIVLCFDRKDSFITAMPVLIPDANPATDQGFVMDKRFTLSKNITRKNPDGTTNEGKNVYVLNEPARSFLLIMTEALDKEKTELINPIDSLPRRNKFSGDYVKDRKNLVSIRDDKRPGRLIFFIHFEQKNNCTGELKGEAAFSSPTIATYHAGGHPCILRLSFTAASVTITELEGCGSYRGLDCVFEGTFIKKKELKKRNQRSKKTAGR